MPSSTEIIMTASCRPSTCGLSSSAGPQPPSEALLFVSAIAVLLFTPVFLRYILQILISDCLLIAMSYLLCFLFNGILWHEGSQMGKCTHNIGELLAGEGRKVLSQGRPELFMGLLRAVGPFGCDFKVDAPPVVRIMPPLDQTFIYKAVYYAGH